MKNERKIEMKFSYSNLKSADQGGNRVGNWHGMPVFASSQHGLKNKSSGVYYIVYDDKNKIVRYKNGDWYEYGTVSEAGNVDEYRSPRSYVQEYQSPQYYKEETHAVCGKPANQCDGTAAAADCGPIGDVKIGIDVDAVLKNAREMTVDSLLDGFNYGLEAKG